MKVFCTIVVFFFFIFSALFAQSTGKLIGVVTDSTSKEALLGVQIYTEEANSSSNYVDGQYELVLSEGSHEVQRRLTPRPQRFLVRGALLGRSARAAVCTAENGTSRGRPAGARVASLSPVPPLQG